MDKHCYSVFLLSFKPLLGALTSLNIELVSIPSLSILLSVHINTPMQKDSSSGTSIIQRKIKIEYQVPWSHNCSLGEFA